MLVRDQTGRSCCFGFSCMRRLYALGSPEYRQGSDWPLCWSFAGADAFGSYLLRIVLCKEVRMRTRSDSLSNSYDACGFRGRSLMTVDVRGTRWMTLIGYLIFFASILSPSILSQITLLHLEPLASAELSSFEPSFVIFNSHFAALPRGRSAPG